jgi:anti-sigma regulatory factor (Ser/Thr protein kinase)
MRARRAAVAALGRLVKVTPALREAVEDIVSELVSAAVVRGAAANSTTTLEVLLERREGRLRVTVRDDHAPVAALAGAPLHAKDAHRCEVGAVPQGAWAELALA